MKSGQMSVLRITIFTSLAACLIATWSRGEDVTATKPAGARGGSDKALLGSPDFYPSPERPLGWRGDGTGKYLGAGPSATEWYRRVNCLTYDLRSQAGKPKDGTGEPVVNQFPFRYRAVREWLVSGPISVKEGAKIDDEIVPGEAKLEPDAGDKIGDTAWVKWAGKPWLLTGWGRSTPPNSKESIMPKLGDRVTIETASIATMPETEIGFNETCADAKGPVAAYAHVYLYAPRDGKIGLLVKAKSDPKVVTGIKMWMNGQVVFSKMADAGSNRMSIDINGVDLKQGWNHFLCKRMAPSADQMRIDVWLWPNYEDLKYEAKNILWMTPLPKSSPQTPIIFAGKIYLNTDNNELICMDMDGKVQWLRTTHVWYSLSEEEKKANPAIKEKIEPLIVKMEEADKQLVTEMNAWRSANTATSKVLADKVAKFSNAKGQLWRDAAKAMEEVDKVKYGSGHLFGGSGSGGASSYATCSDGKYLCDFYGSAFASCYDLNGNRKWTRGVDPEIRPHGPEHGNCSSGVIADGKFLVTFGNNGRNGKVVAFDIETGNIVWSQKASATYQSLVTAKIGNTAVVIDPNFCNIMRISDGKVLWTGGAFNSYAPTMVVDDGVVYAMGGPNIKGPLVVKLPDSEDELAKGLKPLFRFDKTAFGVPSPLVYDGLLYGSDIYASMSVADVSDGKQVYRKQLNLHHYQHLRDGVYCSTTLGGKLIYQTDNDCSTVVFEPGRELKVVAENLLDYAQPPRYGPAQIHDHSGAPGGGPVFCGNRTYFRSASFLYCIGNK